MTHKKPEPFEAFSWQKLRREALALRIKEAHIQAGNKECEPNPDYAILHPDEVKDAKNGNYVKIDDRITKEFKRECDKADVRRKKIGNKHD